MTQTQIQTQTKPSAAGRPIVMRVASPLPADEVVYDFDETYDHASQLLQEGEFFMGSPKRNTRCNKFTLIGADKKHNDDTKEKK
jgi:hypothetical protein